ncbi:YbcC family protein [Negadavirga shengliensis]|uniref:Probable inorganic carbon transporter subunit DabA n=1 Tax=Negadavirga shengliensis TaxID=1389218 RepID=A0ABV9T2T4_9BACT
MKTDQSKGTRDLRNGSRLLSFMSHNLSFDLHQVLHELGHYLPAQPPLKDFVHHNTLHAFQHLPFHEGVQIASENFGYKVYWNLEKYRELYHSGKINAAILERVIIERQGASNLEYWRQLLLHRPVQEYPEPKVGQLRRWWKRIYHLNLDKEVQATLFRLICGYLDQGIAIWKFPVQAKGLLSAVRTIEKNSFTTFVKSERARELLFDGHTTLQDLLELLVGKEERFAQYLFDQQFSHPGWSGMIAVLEQQPQLLLDKKKVSLHDLVFLECILEIDALDRKRGSQWTALAQHIPNNFPTIFETQGASEWYQIHGLWQEAMEWTYYDQVIKGLQLGNGKDLSPRNPGFQAMFCMDDRSCSIRRYVERFFPDCQTFGTAGFFNLPFYFQPEHGKFMTKVCPAPIKPVHVIKETESKIRHEKDAHFSKHSKGILGAWVISQTMGFWSAVKMVKSIFRPGETPAMVSSFRHMDPKGKLGIECKDPDHRHHGLQAGFTVEEMAENMDGLLKSIGLVRDFAPLVYIIGHGASSVNNTHYAGYDCGACSGRAGSVNARVAAFIGNHSEVRKALRAQGINIPDSTRFIGGLHDTTRDEFEFYDEETLPESHQQLHRHNVQIFEIALDYNAKERSRRFHTIDSRQDPQKVHKLVKLRAMSLFEPRPEWNHATNTLCVVGKRESNRHLFLDKRAFLNSYDYSIDPEGKYLLGILKAVAPVCGGINLEYYFSKVDNERLGAGSKLPHNVMGLLGVANGMEGDLRAGLPLQMVNIHDPMRLLVIVEHFPEVLMKIIHIHEPTYEWFINEWVRLVGIHPETKEAFVFHEGEFLPYNPITRQIVAVDNLDAVLESSAENLPVYIIE